MTKTLKILAAALVALLVTAGLAAAAPGFTGQSNGPAMDRQHPMNGSNNPWVTDDERLDRFQDRFDLTDEQMETVRTAVVEQYENDATPAEIQATVTELLADFGVEDADLGPAMDRQRFQDGTGDGPVRDGAGHRFGSQSGHGAMDGSCQT